ncbi:hypothetical protein AUP68_05475 [Ilyonectria robusta]
MRSAGGANQITAGSKELSVMTQQLCRFQYAALGSTSELRARIASEREARTATLPGGQFTGFELPAQRLLKSIKSQQKRASRETERMIQGIQGLTDRNMAGCNAVVDAVMSGFGEQDVQLTATDTEESMLDNATTIVSQQYPPTSLAGPDIGAREPWTLLWKSQCHNQLHKELTEITPYAAPLRPTHFQTCLLRDVGCQSPTDILNLVDTHTRSLATVPTITMAKPTRTANVGHPGAREPGIIRAKAYNCHKELFGVVYGDHRLFGSGRLPLLAFDEAGRVPMWLRRRPDRRH